MGNFERILAAAASGLFGTSTAGAQVPEAVPPAPLVSTVGETVDVAAETPIEEPITLAPEQFIDPQADLPNPFRNESLSRDQNVPELPETYPRQHGVTEEDVWDAFNMDTPVVRGGRVGINQASHGEGIVGFRWSSTHTPENEREEK